MVFQKYTLWPHMKVYDNIAFGLKLRRQPKAQIDKDRYRNAKEIYVNVIEKAYAKLYGSYEKIIGGKVHITLSEMTGGFPEEIKLQKYQETGNV